MSNKWASVILVQENIVRLVTSTRVWPQFLKIKLRIAVPSEELCCARIFSSFISQNQFKFWCDTKEHGNWKSISHVDWVWSRSRHGFASSSQVIGNAPVPGSWEQGVGAENFQLPILDEKLFLLLFFWIRKSTFYLLCAHSGQWVAERCWSIGESPTFTYPEISRFFIFDCFLSCFF